jgi:hypothetical protein
MRWLLNQLVPSAPQYEGVGMGGAEGVSRWSGLRDEILPALRAYGVNNAEVVYVVAQSCKVEAVQFRDAMGLRLPRWTVPVTLATRFDAYVTKALEESQLCDGDGVVTIDIGEHLIVQRHTPNDGRYSLTQEKWRI